jgi:hypothetical protein
MSAAIYPKATGTTTLTLKINGTDMLFVTLKVEKITGLTFKGFYPGCSNNVTVHVDDEYGYGDFDIYGTTASSGTKGVGYTGGGFVMVSNTNPDVFSPGRIEPEGGSIDLHAMVGVSKKDGKTTMKFQSKTDSSIVGTVTVTVRSDI